LDFIRPIETSYKAIRQFDIFVGVMRRKMVLKLKKKFRSAIPRPTPPGFKDETNMKLIQG
jgi:hypothetical protein